MGNRLGGERLGQLVSFEALKLAGGVVLLSPFLPLLFMGEEYGETAPFPYFVSHSDAGLIEAMRQGRVEEFAAFHWPGEPPDPLDEAIFLRAKLDHTMHRNGKHQVLWEFYRELLRLREELSLLTNLGRRDREVEGYEREKVLRVRMQGERGEALILFYFGKEPLALSLPWPPGPWQKRLDSAEPGWGGPGSQAPPVIEGENETVLRLSPLSLVVYLRQDS